MHSTETYFWPKVIFQPTKQGYLDLKNPRNTQLFVYVSRFQLHSEFNNQSTRTFAQNILPSHYKLQLSGHL